MPPSFPGGYDPRRAYPPPAPPSNLPPVSYADGWAIWIYGLGLRGQGLGLLGQGLGFGGQGSGFRAQGLGIRVWGLDIGAHSFRVRVKGSGVRV